MAKLWTPKLWTPRAERMIAGETYDNAYFEPSAYESAGRRGGHGGPVRGKAPKQPPTPAICIRLARSVINLDDFDPELKLWKPLVMDNAATRRSRGSLALTVFDNKQQRVGNPQEFTDESLRETLEWRCPELFEESPRIPVAGVGILGAKAKPWLVLLFKEGPLHTQQKLVRDTFAPGLMIDDNQVSMHKPHVSLGQIVGIERGMSQADVTSTAEQMRAELAAAIPRYVEFTPLDIDFSPSQY